MSDMKRLISGAYILGYSDARNDKAIDPIGAIERLTMNMNKRDLISRQDAIDEIEYELEMINSALDSITLDFNARERLRQRKGEAREILNSIQQLPSAQPNILDDGTLTITVPHGMLSKVNRVIVDEVGTKFCKMMYQERTGHWIIQDGQVVCSECGEPNRETDYCPFCGAHMEGEEE